MTDDMATPVEALLPGAAPLSADHLELVKRIDASGYAFQLKVQSEIEATKSKHHWEVISAEHAWESGERNGFTDLIIRHREYSTILMVIECKRLKSDDGSQLSWVFLRPKGDPIETIRVRALGYGEIRPNPASGRDTRLKVKCWEDLQIEPVSPESDTCIQKQEKTGTPLLESLAATLLNAAEGLMSDEIAMHHSQDRLTGPAYVLATIVTNASLFICDFDPAETSITSGTLNKSNVQLSEVPFVRFRKSLTTKFPEGRKETLGEVNEARERTVFVVNARELSHFLSGWNVHRPYDGYELERMLKAR